MAHDTHKRAQPPGPSLAVNPRMTCARETAPQTKHFTNPRPFPLPLLPVFGTCFVQEHPASCRQAVGCKSALVAIKGAVPWLTTESGRTCYTGSAWRTASAVGEITIEIGISRGPPAGSIFTACMVDELEAFRAAPADRYVATSRFGERSGAISSDGRWMAFATDETGDHQVNVKPGSSDRRTLPDLNAGRIGGARPVMRRCRAVLRQRQTVATGARANRQTCRSRCSGATTSTLGVLA